MLAWEGRMRVSGGGWWESRGEQEKCLEDDCEEQRVLTGMGCS